MNLSTKQLEQRDGFLAARKELLDGADALITSAEREGRDDLTGAEDTRLRSVLDRARRLGRKAEGHDDTPHDFTARSAIFRAVATLHLAAGNHATAIEMARRNADPEVALVIRAAAAGADTATSAWAGAVVSPALGEFIPLLRALSTLFALAPQPLPFGRYGSVNYPRMTTGSASGFVAEGTAIPVKANALETMTVAPYKAAGIVVCTSELMRRADAFTESFVIGTLADDIALGVDQVFLSSSASSTAAPAGLFHSSNAASAIAATAGANALAAATDLANLLAAGASMRQPVLLINPASAAKALRLATASDFPIIGALLSGRIFNAEVIFSGNLATTTVALVDRNDLIVAGGDGLEIDVSVHAELHMDTAPNADALAPASGGTSLYQRDMIATAIKLPITWRTKRTAAVQRVESATWA